MADYERVGRLAMSAPTEFSAWDVVDDEPRPTTATVPSKTAKPASRGAKRSARSTASAVETLLDDWYEDDRPEEAVPTSTRRESRLDELARHSGKPPATYAKEPSKQVLRQRTLAVMELAPPDSAVPDAVATPGKSNKQKSLVSHHRRERRETDETKLPTISKHTAAPRGVGLFGPHIDDSHEMRTLLFQHFLPVWSLLPTPKAPDDAALNSPPRSSSAAVTVGRDRKSPLDCSMTLMKICKAIGIALATPLPPDVWTSSKRRCSTTTLSAARPSGDVDLDTFAEFVVRNAVQPALHHFRIDRDVDEYLHTLDTVVRSLVVQNDDEDPSISRWRLRELGELQPVLAVWKKGIPTIQKQAPLIKTSPSAAAFQTPVYSIVQASGDETVVQASEPHTKKLSAYEARALQDANIRRKIQLRNSWQSRIVATDEAPVNLHEMDADASHALGSCIRVEGAPRRPALANAPPREETEDHIDNQVIETVVPNEPSVQLLCGSCPGESEATLWCSACFAVYCTTCWTSTHHTTVDLRGVMNQHDLMAPSARPLATQRDVMAPPVAITYLPTKPLTSGKLLRGSSVPNYETNQAEDRESETLVHAISSHAMLPSLKPIRRTASLLKHGQSAPALDRATQPPVSSAMNSTANLLKALMLGTASSASVLGSSRDASPWSGSSDAKSSASTVSRTSKGPTNRPNLQPKAITLDATALFP